MKLRSLAGLSFLGVASIALGYIFLGILKDFVDLVHDEVPLNEYGIRDVDEGQLKKAIEANTRVIEASPVNYNPYYERSIIYLMRHDVEAAIRDADVAVELSSGTIPKAWWLKGKIAIKQGDWKSARHYLTERFMKAGGDKRQASKLIHLLDELELQMKKAEDAVQHGSFKKCFQILSNLLEHSPFSKEIFRLRGACALEMGNAQRTLGDLISITNFTDASIDDFIQAARFSYFFGRADDSTKTQTVLLDCMLRFSKPEKCTTFLRKVKRLDASFLVLARLHEVGDWRRLTSILVRFGDNHTDTMGFLPKFDAELDLALSPVSFDAKEFSARRRMLASMLCIAAGNLDVQSRVLYSWCRGVRYSGLLGVMRGFLGWPWR